MNNPIIQEVRETRETLAARFEFDLHRIIADAMRRQDQQSITHQQTRPNKTSMTTGGAFVSSVVRKRPGRPSTP